MVLPETYTVQQLAEILQLSLAQIRRMLRSGDIPGIKLGNEWRVRKTTFHKWLEEKEKSLPKEV